MADETREFRDHEFRAEHSPVERQIIGALQVALHRLHQIIEKQENIMSALTDLQAADQLETSTLVTIGQAIADTGTRVEAAIAALGASNDPAIAAVATDLQSHVATLQTLATALAAIAPVAVVATPVANPVASPTT